MRRPFLLFPLAAAVLAVAVAAGSPVGCASAPACQFNSDCPVGYCSKGVCKQDCIDSEIDCPAGTYCNIVSQCVPGTGGAAGSGGGSSTTSVTGTSATTTSTTTTTTTTATTTTATTTATTTTGTGAGGKGAGGQGTGGAAGTGKELDLCATDGDCLPALLCRPFTAGGAQRCTNTCGANADCASGTRCETIGGATYCAGNDVGLPCTAAASCGFGCLTGPGYCTAACASGADCPNGYGCEGVGNPPTSVCVKAEAPCSAADTSACIAAAACDTSATLLVGGCTLACSSAADCPQRAAGFTAWTCDGLCRRPPDVYGPLPEASPAQYACNAAGTAVDVCDDANHIDFAAFTIPPAPAVDCSSPTTTAGEAGDSCVDSCLYQGGCIYGAACVAVGNVGAFRIGLCFPTGTGEVGTACTTGEDCFFGACSAGKCSRDCSADGVCPTGSSCVAGGAPAVEGLPYRLCQ
jgi:hypothetical protein